VSQPLNASLFRVIFFGGFPVGHGCGILAATIVGPVVDRCGILAATVVGASLELAANFVGKIVGRCGKRRW
jgi:hypothetical protein